MSNIISIEDKTIKIFGDVYLYLQIPYEYNIFDINLLELDLYENDNEEKLNDIIF